MVNEVKPEDALPSVMPSENLGFFMPDYGLDIPQSADASAKRDIDKVDDDDASSGYQQSIVADLPKEAPVVPLCV